MSESYHIHYKIIGYCESSFHCSRMYRNLPVCWHRLFPTSGEGRCNCDKARIQTWFYWQFHVLFKRVLYENLVYILVLLSYYYYFGKNVYFLKIICKKIRPIHSNNAAVLIWHIIHYRIFSDTVRLQPRHVHRTSIGTAILLQGISRVYWFGIYLQGLCIGVVHGIGTGPAFWLCITPRG